MSAETEFDKIRLGVISKYNIDETIYKFVISNDVRLSCATLEIYKYDKLIFTLNDAFDDSKTRIDVSDLSTKLYVKDNIKRIGICLTMKSGELAITINTEEFGNKLYELLLENGLKATKEFGRPDKLIIVHYIEDKFHEAGQIENIITDFWPGMDVWNEFSFNL